MTHLTLTVDTARKRLRFSGDAIAAGEHVGVTVTGFGSAIGEGRNLRLRVMDCKRLVALFPHVETDAWDEDEDGNAVCELNLNSIELRRATRCGGCEFDFILDDIAVPQMYGEGTRFVGEWRKEPGADEPYSLDRYPDIIREFGERLDGFEEDVDAAKAAAEDAKTSAANAALAADTAGRSAAGSLTAANAAANSANAASASASAAQAAVEAVEGGVEAAQAAATASAASAASASAKAIEAATSAAEAVEAVEEKADQADLDAHANDQTNPHNVTKQQLGLGSVDNVADRYKPVSEAQRAAINEEKARAQAVEETLRGEIERIGSAAVEKSAFAVFDGMSNPKASLVSLQETVVQILTALKGI